MFLLTLEMKLSCSVLTSRLQYFYLKCPSSASVLWLLVLTLLTAVNSSCPVRLLIKKLKGWFLPCFIWLRIEKTVTERTLHSRHVAETKKNSHGLRSHSFHTFQDTTYSHTHTVHVHTQPGGINQSDDKRENNTLSVTTY